MKTKMTIRLSDGDCRALKALARQRGTGVSDVVRDIVRRYLAVARFHEAQAEIMPYARARGILTDEDVFKIVS